MEKDVQYLVSRQGLVSCEWRQVRNLVRVNSQKVLAIGANLHSERLSHFSAGLAFDLSQDLGRHKALQHFLERYLKVVHMAIVVEGLRDDCILVYSGACSLIVLSSRCQGFVVAYFCTSYQSGLKQGFHSRTHTSYHDGSLFR